jgi:hypothetical protein
MRPGALGFFPLEYSVNASERYSTDGAMKVAALWFFQRKIGDSWRVLYYIVFETVRIHFPAGSDLFSDYATTYCVFLFEHDN